MRCLVPYKFTEVRDLLPASIVRENLFMSSVTFQKLQTVASDQDMVTEP
jgi:hypothetical protein